MTPPTTEQLLILADRAGRGRLTPAEAAVLRAGIARQAEQLRKSGATNAGLQARIRELKDKAPKP